MKSTRFRVLLSLGIAMILSACSGQEGPAIKSGELTLSFNNQLHTKVDFSSAETDLTGDFQASEILKINGETVSDFEQTEFSNESINDLIGNGSRLIISGETDQESPYQIKKTVTATVYDDIPNLIITQVDYENIGDENIDIQGWENNRYTLAGEVKDSSQASFWSFQSGTYPTRQDWVLPVGKDFYQKNYQGMNSSDYGGGIPIVDVWRPDAGLAVGHIDIEPQLVSFPVRAKNEDGVQISVTFDADSISQQKLNRSIAPGKHYSTLETFVTGHEGDFFTSIQKYRQLLQAKGVHFADAPDTAYEPIWCAWGYEREFTVDQVINTLPKVKELGFEWAVLDDGWQIAEGSWVTNNKFNETSMKEFVDQIHAQGMKAKLWWAPLAADPGSNVHENETDMLLVNKAGDYQHITWWDSHYMNPALNSTKEYHKQLVQKFMGEWGYDGLKIDGQHLNQVPPDYGHENEQEYPEKSVEELPDFYKIIYDTALEIKPDAVVEICPCGASISSFITPFMNQSVSSDPLNSWQIRLKGKTYKALMGVDAAYYGDHVELSDDQSDFASSVGIGGVIGTKFTWPASSAPDSEFLLTEEKEALVAKWMDIYNKYMLPKGNYRGELYDLGFYSPEAHAVEKDGKLFYAFYSDSFDGEVELRGLESDKEYHLINYETGEELGTVTGPEAKLETSFTHHVMVMASPE